MRAGRTPTPALSHPMGEGDYFAVLTIAGPPAYRTALAVNHQPAVTAKVASKDHELPNRCPLSRRTGEGQGEGVFESHARRLE
jgi:hypothetical protein